MSKQLIKDSLGWGFALWLIGYALGMLLFAFVPVSLIGWIILPIGTLITLFVLTKKINGTSMQHYFTIAIVWTLIALVGDYLFIVKALNPPDGYYKLDVYIYYILTFVLPLFIGWRKEVSSK